MENEKKDLIVEPLKADKKLLPVLDLVKKSWALYRANFKKLISMYLLSAVAVLAFAFVVGATVVLGILGGNHWFVVLIAVLLFLAGLCGFIYYVVRTQIALTLLVNKPEAPFWETFKESRKHFWPYLWVSILTQLICLGIILVFLIIIFAILAVVGFGAFQSGDLSAVLSVAPVGILLFLMMIVAIMIFAVYFGFGRFTYLFEDKKGGQALKRSFELVKSKWWLILWRYLAIMLLFYLVIMIVSIPAFIAGDKSAFAIFWNFIVQIGTIIITPLFIIYYFFMFRDLQSLKSGK